MGEPITKERLHKYIFIRREVENHLERLTRMKNQALIPARRDGDGSQHTPGGRAIIGLIILPIPEPLRSI